MKFLTWDAGLLAGLGILLAYSLLIRKHKALATLVSCYIAYVMTTLWGDQVSQFFSGNQVLFNQVWIKASASPYMVSAIMLIVVTLLLSTFLKLGGKRARYSSVEVVVYAVSTVALIGVFLVSFMNPTMRAQVFASSTILPALYTWRQWVLLLPVFAMVFFGIYGNEE